MASDRELKQRIRSVKSIGQITNAMKMVASSQIRKVEAKTEDGRPYTKKLREIIDILIEAAKPLGNKLNHPLLQARPVKKTAVIVVGSDNGLCGGYNSNLAKATIKSLKKLPVRPAKLVCLGNKAARFLVREGYKPDETYLKWEPSSDLADKLAELFSKWFLNGEVDEVLCIYTKSVNALTCEPTQERLLPMASLEASAESGSSNANDSQAFKDDSDVASSQTANTPLSSAQDETEQDYSNSLLEEDSCDGDEGQLDPYGYIFEPNLGVFLEQLVPMYLRVVVMQMLLESKKAEVSSRLRAMTNATDNAEKLASELTLQYYRVRQNNITTEIIEIASGAEALKG